MLDDYRTEKVSSWENSALDARIYATGDAALAQEAGPLGDVRSLVEAVHHANRAGDTDAAAAVLYNRVYRGPDAYLTKIMGSYSTALDVMTDFFPDRDLRAEPRLGSAAARRWILHETALCLHVLGDLTAAIELGRRAAAAAQEAGDRHSAALSYHNLAESYLAVGLLPECQDVTGRAMDLAVDAGEDEDQLVCHTLLGEVADLRAEPHEADQHFAAALAIAEEQTSVPILYSLSGVRYAEHLLYAGRTTDAGRVAQDNVTFCREQGWQGDVALALAQLAQVSAEPGDVPATQADDAVAIARTIGARQVLTEVLYKRGALSRRRGLAGAAFADQREALELAQTEGLKRRVVDVRIARAQLNAEAGQGSTARTEATLAAALAEELGYVRGQRAARAVLVAL